MKQILKNKLFKNTIIISIYIFITEIMFEVLGSTFVFYYPILRILVSSVIIGYFLSLILNFIKSNWLNKIIIMIFSFGISFYAMLQLGFRNFIGNYMSFNTSSQLVKVTDYIKDYFMSFDIKFYLILIPFVLLILYYIFIDKRIKTENYKFVQYKFVNSITVLVLLCGFYYSTLLLDFMQNKYQSIENKTLFKNPSMQSIAINQFGVSVYGLLDVKNYLLGLEYSDDVYLTNGNSDSIVTDRTIDDTIWQKIIDSEEDDDYNTLNKFFISRNITNTNEYTGLFEGKNLILIMMESVNNISVTNKEEFPTLYKLYNEGWHFKNNYSPRSSCSTGNNEFSALTSLYAINTLCSSNIFKNNTYYESLFNVFKNKGYTSLAFHDYTDYYYDRHISMPNLGSKYYGVVDLGIDYSNEYKEWPSDVDFIEKAYDIFSKEDKFSVLLTTVTTHQPYYTSSTYGDEYLDLFSDLNVHLYLKRYMSKMKVLDQALDLLLKKLENDKLIDDTVIVLFGDHYPYGLANSVLQPMFDYDISINQEVDRTPFIIYNSKLEPREFDSYTTYINILPTLANLFNLDYDPRLYLGEDLFDENYSNIAIFSDSSWQSPYAFYNSSKSKLSYINNDYKYTDEEIKNINDIINSKISISNKAIRKDYFTYLNNKFNEFNESN